MGKEESTETAGQILTAARRTFARVGFHGARMQEIANEASINKAVGGGKSI